MLESDRRVSSNLLAAATLFALLAGSGTGHAIAAEGPSRPAAARTVAEPTSNRLRDVIQKVSNAIVLDQQLEECDLTFADLHRIQEAFHRLLVSMYHHRVEYPGFEFNRGPKSGEKTADRKAVRGS